MSTTAMVLKVLPALGLLGCVSDFSPDPYKNGDYSVLEKDAGAAGKDASKPDGTVSTPPKDSGGPVDDTDAGSEPPPKDAEVDPAGPCDLTGRWLMAERMISSAYGAKQVSIAWHYVEIAQQGEDVTMTKTLMCGGLTQQAPGDFFEVKMDDSGAWKGYQLHTNYNGRKGTSKASGSGCVVTWAEDALVRGCTVPAYKDRNLPLPATVADQATADNPGWEDWDEDGRVGITMTASGLASGKMFTSLRTFNDSTGTIEANADNFLLDLNWSQERKVIEYEPITAFILVSDASRAPDPGQNVVEFGRFGTSDATGDDTAKCEAVRTLAPTLTPRGSNATEKL